MGNTSYQYDGVGRRVQQTVGAQVTQYLLDTQPAYGRCGRTQGAIPLGMCRHQAAAPSSNPSGALVWKVLDGLGSVRNVVDSGANSLESQLYDPYGEGYGRDWEQPNHVWVHGRTH